MGPRPVRPKYINGLLVQSGKAYMLPTDHLITGKPLRSEPAKKEWFQVKPSNICVIGLVGWLYLKPFLEVITS